MLREMLGLNTGILSKLHADHEEVSALIETILNASGAQRTEAFKEMRAKLSAHADAEQKVLYKRMEKDGEEEARSFAYEGEVEHGLVHELLDQLGRSRAKDSEQWTAKMNVLKDMIEHHVAEEEGTGFSAARATFDGDELEKLGERFEREKEKLLAEA
jgi:hemerythrin-like domain-containing protein